MQYQVTAISKTGTHFLIDVVAESFEEAAYLGCDRQMGTDPNRKLKYNKKLSIDTFAVYDFVPRSVIQISVQIIEKTFEVVRFFRDNHNLAYVLMTNMTLEEAQEHCRDPESSSSTCTTLTGKAMLKRNGPWFDGYREEQDSETD